jgi:hypothetical protein
MVSRNPLVYVHLDSCGLEHNVRAGQQRQLTKTREDTLNPIHFSSLSIYDFNDSMPHFHYSSHSEELTSF